MLDSNYNSVAGSHEVDNKYNECSNYYTLMDSHEVENTYNEGTL